MILHSKHWDEKLGVCTLHYLPETPCPACLAEQQENIWVEIGERTKEFYADYGIGFEGLFSEEGQWLVDRIR